MSAAERAEARRQKILAKGTERMSKVSGLYTKSSGDALGSVSQGTASEHLRSASALLDSSEEHKSSITAKASPSASHAAHVQSTNSFCGNADAGQDKQIAPDCELPSVSNPKLKFDPPLVSSSPAQRAPGVNAFRADSKASHAVPKLSRPPSPRFSWTLAVWVVAVTFCVAVQAHTLELLPPAPYVLVLVAVILPHARILPYCTRFVTQQTQAMGCIVVLSRFTVRALAYQAIRNLLHVICHCCWLCIAFFVQSNTSPLMLFVFEIPHDHCAAAPH
jgi:hypothetical protein